MLPFRAGAHPGMNGSFFVIQFPERFALKPMIYLENLADTWAKRGDSAVERYGNGRPRLQGPAGARPALHRRRLAVVRGRRSGTASSPGSERRGTGAEGVCFEMLPRY
ncbi:hypothetical protein [Streptomyces sp. SPB162]|uniref:hypothetical protein n=1 Tax=Streptomyces sp. SPB162 TaxID=2940560 RepID=UPI003216CC5D